MGLKNLTLNAVAKVIDVEIHEQAETHSGQAHVRKELSLVDPEQLFDCFEFDDHGVLDKQIEPEPRIEPLIQIDDRHLDLSAKGDSRLLHLMTETLLICALEQAGTEG
jgi:hypothetical protein